MNTILGTIVINSLASDIQFPTFSDTINDLQLLGCLLGQWIASLFWVSFSCSAQAGQRGNPLFPTPPPPPPLLSTFPTVSVPQADWTPGQGMCTYTIADWAASNMSACNCTQINGTWYNTNGTIPVGCLAKCLAPAPLAFPYTVGYSQIQNFAQALQCYVPMMLQTTFSTLATVQAFFASTFSAPYANFTQGFNPTNLTSGYPTIPTYGEGALMQSLVAADLGFGTCFSCTFSHTPTTQATIASTSPTMTSCSTSAPTRVAPPSRRAMQRETMRSWRSWLSWRTNH